MSVKYSHPECDLSGGKHETGYRFSYGCAFAIEDPWRAEALSGPGAIPSIAFRKGFVNDGLFLTGGEIASLDQILDDATDHFA